MSTTSVEFSAVELWFNFRDRLIEQRSELQDRAHNTSLLPAEDEKQYAFREKPVYCMHHTELLVLVLYNICYSIAYHYLDTYSHLPW